MQYIQHLEAYQESLPSAVTLGKFDSLHKGHQKLLNCVCELTHSKVKSVVFAIDMRGFKKRNHLPIEQLLLNSERKQCLDGLVDYLVECPLTTSFQQLSPEEFIEKILVNTLHAKYVVVGSDYRFGYQAKGDIETLKTYAHKFQYHVIVIEKETYKGREISSTYIKELLQKGDCHIAHQLLGYPYSFRGEVIHGRKLGRTIGFPTMNVIPEHEKLIPARGVYLCKIMLDGQMQYGICNIGNNPTVDDQENIKLEVHAFQLQEEVYGKQIKVSLLEFIRPETKFNTIDQLKDQITADILVAKKYIYN